MTALVAIENIDNFDEEILVTRNMLKNVTNDLSVAGFKVGDTLSYNKLLYGTILKSGADATEILAHCISGSEKEFVKLMNAKAKELKMNNTSFSNVIGIEGENHYSSARDLMTLLKYALNNEKFKEVFTTVIFEDMSGPLNIIKNQDAYNMDYIKGAKTGYTSRAGLCLASYAKKDNTEFILITIGAPHDNRNEHFVDTKDIYEYFFKNYDYINILSKGDNIIKLTSKYGKEYEIKSDKDIKMYLNKNITKSDLIYKYKGKTNLEKGTKKKEKVGDLYIMNNEEVLYSLNVLSPDNISFDFIFFVKNNKEILFLPLLTILIVYMIIRIKKR